MRMLRSAAQHCDSRRQQQPQLQRAARQRLCLHRRAARTRDRRRVTMAGQSQRWRRGGGNLRAEAAAFAWLHNSRGYAAAAAAAVITTMATRTTRDRAIARATEA
jgi:hypothetical protein